MEIGYAQSDISPDINQPVFLAGFGRNRVATGIHDPLSARVLVMQDGNSPGNLPIVLVALDLIGLGRSECLRIASHVPSVHLIICCTHTHHGPDTIGLWGPDLSTSGIDSAYMKRLEELIISTIHRAIAQMQPACLKSCSVKVEGVAKNGRDPQIIDNELSLIQFFDSMTDKVIATMAVFPCHPETLFDQNTIITSDYPHFLRDEIESATNAPSIFFSGALGGMMTPDVVDHSFSEAQANGEKLANVGLLALSGALKKSSSIEKHKTIEFSIPLQSPILEIAIQTGLVAEVNIHEQHVSTETSLLCMGDTWLCFAPGEVLPALGLEMKTRMSQSGVRVPIVIGLANDELGYILPDEVYEYPQNPFEPGDHYEETMSIGPNAGSCLLKAFDKLCLYN